ncbi:MAG: exodeoxyribonuclease VII small subunit [Tannerella sp.]|jgi:exodeoxyribonuclease VII small subunit|nr:exodeoxyribonuclease VII small subunit [Tannerella sp.]
MKPEAGNHSATPDDAALNYTEAYTLLKNIVTAVERNEIPVDELPANAARALELMKICKAKLEAAEAGVRRVFEAYDEVRFDKPDAE